LIVVSAISGGKKGSESGNSEAGAESTATTAAVAQAKTALSVDQQDGLKTTHSTLKITGKATPGATVAINSEAADVDADGHWSGVASLDSGANSVVVLANAPDTAKTEVSITVTRHRSAKQVEAARRLRAKKAAAARERKRIRDEKKAAAAAAAKEEEERSSGQRNALESAQNYIDLSGFSREGLIEQLSSSAADGYSLADATYAADHVNADWNAEAVEAAKNYLDLTAMSKDGLIEQLSSSAGDKFTLEQAQYAAEKVY
jgi:hypothetical protein